MYLSELKTGDQKTLDKPVDLRVLSLGAGVQSSTLLFKIINKEIKPVDVVIFSDTGNEPKSVYDWLDYLSSVMKDNDMEFHIVRSNENTGNIVNDYKSKTGRHAFLPLHIIRPSGKSGIARRTCTYEYKIRPLHQWIRKHFGVKYLTGKHVEMVMGISYDEIARVNIPRDKWQVNCYPLVDNKIERSDCIAWMKEGGYGEPPRSACVICPYRSNKEWRYLKETDHGAFHDAVEFDEYLRNDEKGVGKEKFSSFVKNSKPFLYHGKIPLKEADFSGELSYEPFDDECEGMCGV